MTGISHDLNALTSSQLDGTTITHQLRATGKSALAAGQHNGRPAVIKMLTTDDDFWTAKFLHEIAMYRAFTESPPPVRVPALLHTDGHRVLVLEHIPGPSVAADRYPDTPIHSKVVNTVLDTVTAFTAWNPTLGVLVPVWDYAERIERYTANGFLTDTDRTALRALLDEAGPARHACHGDVLPSNLLLPDDDRCVLIDWEFAGLFLPGVDLATLRVVLTNTPAIGPAVDTLVAESDIQASYLVNLGMVLAREQRIHVEIPDTDIEFRRTRLALLEPLWDCFRNQLHRR
jgi:serine/threonine protein kinase